MKNIYLLIILGLSLLLSGACSIEKSYEKNKRGVIRPPQIITPTNGAIIDDTVCTVSWTKGRRDPMYFVEVSENLGFSNSKEYMTFDTTINIHLGIPTYINKYIRVKACKDPSRCSEWSDTLTITHGRLQHHLEEIQHVGCSGNCGHCKHPCGRRPNPDLYEIEE